MSKMPGHDHATLPEAGRTPEDTQASLHDHHLDACVLTTSGDTYRRCDQTRHGLQNQKWIDCGRQ